MQIIDEKLLLDTKAYEVFMPALSSTMEEGKVVQWLKQPGEFVKKGEPIMVVESDKADMDVESFEEGYLAVILVNEGEACGVGQTVGLIAAIEADIKKVQDCGLACIVSGSGSRHDGTTAVETPVAAVEVVDVPAVPEQTVEASAPPAAPSTPAVEKPDYAELFMPALSSTMTEGKIVDWLKSEGDKINVGDMVMVVESDKADMDCEAFEEGYLAHILVDVGGQCPVGDAVGYIAKTEADIATVKAWALAQSDRTDSIAGNGIAAPAAPSVTEPKEDAVPAASATPL